MNEENARLAARLVVPDSTPARIALTPRGVGLMEYQRRLALQQNDDARRKAEK